MSPRQQYWLVVAQHLMLLLTSCAADKLRPACPVYCWQDELRDHVVRGACHPGKPTCDVNGKVLSCTGETEPGIEVCNGQDDDCDGDTDEWSEVWDARAMSCPVSGVCNRWMWDCLAGQELCHWPQYYESVETSCDGRDNDCDGWVDEDLFPGQYCWTGPIGGEVNLPCHPGVLACVSGDVVCANQHLPEEERCDSLDNDCNGVADDVVQPVARDIVIAIDRSGSMYTEIQSIINALDAFVQASPSNWRWALVTFTDSVGIPPELWRVDVPFGSVQDVRQALLALTLEGGWEVSLDVAYHTCLQDDQLTTGGWADGAIRMLLLFTDELPQSNEGLTVSGVGGTCVNESVVVNVWAGITSVADYTALGETHLLSTDQGQILQDLEAMVFECGVSE